MLIFFAKPDQTKSSTIHSLSSTPHNFSAASFDFVLDSEGVIVIDESRIVYIAICHQEVEQPCWCWWQNKHQHCWWKHEKAKTHLKRGSASVAESIWCLRYSWIHTQMNCVMPVLAKSKRMARMREENGWSWSGLGSLLLLTVHPLPSCHHTHAIWTPTQVVLDGLLARYGLWSTAQVRTFHPPQNKPGDPSAK